MFIPTYHVTNNLLKYIGRIEACKEVISNAPLIPAWEAQFRDDAKVRTIYHGTHLEGNDLTKEQASIIIHGQQNANALEIGEESGIVARERDIQEILNYRRVLEWIDEWGSFTGKTVTYSEQILKTIHTLVATKVLPDTQVGQYRTQQVVVRSVEDSSVVFKPPMYIEIPEQVSSFMTWLNVPANREISGVLRAGIALYELVRIHPFIDGNGRAARAFALLILYAEGYDIKKLFSIEEYFDRDIDGYYRAILSVQQSLNQDMTYWLEYFAFGLAVELDKIKQRVLKLSKDAQLKDQLGGVQVALTERQIAVLELIREKRSVTTAEVMKILPLISSDTILRDLKDMMKKGLIKKEGITKGVVYYLR